MKQVVIPVNVVYIREGKGQIQGFVVGRPDIVADGESKSEVEQQLISMVQEVTAKELKSAEDSYKDAEYAKVEALEIPE